MKSSIEFIIPNRTSQDIRYLQNLADMLDLYVGVETRKEILEGNERLTLATDAHSWTAYFSEVMKKLDSSIDQEKRAKILTPIGSFSDRF